MSDTYHRYAEKKAGLSNKFYSVSVEQAEDGYWRWTFRWGRIGTNGQTQTGRDATFETARYRCDEKFVSKLRGGYREVSALEMLASCGEEMEERSTRGLPEVAFEIPSFETGNPATDKRLDGFLRKYARKMNIIRGSRYDLGYDETATQVESLLKRYRAEFKRIRGTQTHGRFVNEETDGKVQAFFTTLRRSSDVPVVICWW